MRKATTIILAALSLMLLASCTSVISKKTRLQALDVPYTEVKDNIEKYKGSVFLWGGTIARTEITNSGTVIEVVEKPVNRYGDILDEDMSEGRFLAVYKGHLDPLIYRKQRDVTVAGKLVGSESRKVGEALLTYPVIEVEEIYLWKDYMYRYDYPYYNYQPYWYYPWGGYPYLYPYPYSYPYPYFPPP